MSVQIDKIDSIHVYIRGDVSQEGALEHVSTMDCWCEPVTQVYIEQSPRGTRSLPIVVHGPAIQAVVVLPEEKDEKPKWKDQE